MVNLFVLRLLGSRARRDFSISKLELVGFGVVEFSV